MAPKRLQFYWYCLCCLLAVSLPLCNRAQSADPQVFRQGTRYLDINLHALDKFTARATRTRARLLHKLARREKVYAAQLRRRDSAAYASYVAAEAGRPSFDSIRYLLLHPDSATLAARFSRGAQSAVDSLKGVAAFLQSNSSAAGLSPELAKYGPELSGLQSQLNYQQYIDELTAGRVAGLQNGATLSGLTGNIPALGSIQKDVYYAKSKIAAWRQVADDPSKAEEKALEYLQGLEGFDGKLDAALNGGNPLTGSPAMAMGGSSTAGAVTADDLEKMGYQTKRQVNAALQKQFGSGLGAVQGQMGQQVSAWQQKAQGLVGDVKETGKALKGGLRDVSHPSFHINPMRGLPFWKRIEKSWSFDTRRAAAGQPAVLSAAAMAGFKQSPRLSAGIGVVGDLGLGQSFSAIRFSFEGVGVRSYVAWQLVWGIGAYGGYERVYKKAFFAAEKKDVSILNPTTHNTTTYDESMLLGFIKSYYINSRYNGTIQLLYDFWWKEKNLNTPIILRFTTQKK